MEALVGAVIGVFGTLLGSVVTHFFQRSATLTTERGAKAERRRLERREALAELAHTATDLRRAANSAWHNWRRREGHEPGPYEPASDEFYRVFATARKAQIMLRLLAVDAHIEALAEAAVEAAAAVKEAADEGSRDAQASEARRSLDEFLEAAAQHLAQ